MGATVLVVDEDPDVLAVTKPLLERESEGLTVETEQSVTAALERVRDGGVDCVVSDLRMPEMDGLAFFEAVREHADLPFFIMSAAGDDATRMDALDAGVTGFVEKGVGTDHYETLAAEIEAALER